MKHITLLLAICAFLVGCHTNDRTLLPGIYHGMTPEEIVAHLPASQKIISRDNSRIVTEGYDKDWGMKRRNIFHFQNGKLVVYQNNPVAE